MNCVFHLSTDPRNLLEVRLGSNSTQSVAVYHVKENEWLREAERMTPAEVILLLQEEVGTDSFATSEVLVVLIDLSGERYIEVQLPSQGSITSHYTLRVKARTDSNWGAPTSLSFESLISTLSEHYAPQN